jgi:hypothetical protein
MKVKIYRKRIKTLRALAVAGCLAAAVPTAASAYPTSDSWAPPVRHENGPSVVKKTYTPPPGFYASVQLRRSAPQTPFTPSPGFHTEAQLPVRTAADRRFTLPTGFHPEVQSSSPSQTAPSSTPTVIRETHTVTDDGGRTLAIVLASIAIAIALCSTAYAAVRITRMQRRALGS